MKKIIFEGAATALVTPFSCGRVDETALCALIEEQIAAGVSALVICGTTGEASTMTDKERADVISLAVKAARGRVPVIAGAGSNDTAHAAELSLAAEEAGADALLIVTPYYNKTSQAGLVKTYETLATAVNLPIIVYNVPSRTGMTVEPETYAALADIPNVCAVKEASSDMSKFARATALSGDRLTFYCGNDDLTVPMMALGARGVISVLSNVLPRDVSRMCERFFSGDIAEAARMQLEFLPLISALFSDVNPVPVKEALALMNKCRADVRLPLVQMSDDKKPALKKALAAAGIFIG